MVSSTQGTWQNGAASQLPMLLISRSASGPISLSAAWLSAHGEHGDPFAASTTEKLGLTFLVLSPAVQSRDSCIALRIPRCLIAEGEKLLPQAKLWSPMATWQSRSLGQKRGVFSICETCHLW